MGRIAQDQQPLRAWEEKCQRSITLSETTKCSVSNTSSCMQNSTKSKGKAVFIQGATGQGKVREIQGQGKVREF